MASQLRVISSIITILFVKSEGLKMTAASILDDVYGVECGPALSNGAFIKGTAITFKYPIQLRTEM